MVAAWDVTREELDDRARAVHVWLEQQSGTSFVCPECQPASSLYDHVERSWRHLDTCQYETRLHARVPCIARLTHGVKTVPVAWATAHSRFTLLFERLAIAWLKEAPRWPWRDAWGSRGEKPMGSSSGRPHPLRPDSVVLASGAKSNSPGQVTAPS